MKAPTKKELLAIAKNNFGLIASFCTILTLMFFLFATQWDLAAVAQTVDRDRCKSAQADLGRYEFLLLQSKEKPTPEMLAVMADLKQIIAESCPKK